MPRGADMGAAKKDTSKIILASAFKCISSRGCASVTLREIAEDAGVALSQLNYYYENKEGLFAEVLKSIRIEYITGIEVNMAQFGTVKSKIAFLIGHNRQLLQTNQALYRSFLDFFNLAMWSESFRKDMNAFLNDIAVAIEKQIEEKDPAMDASGAYSPSALARMILGTSFGIAMQYLLNPEHEELLDGFSILESVLQ
jgi:AcrR family transcriptional regulator